MKLQELAVARKYAQAYVHVCGSRLTEENFGQIEQFIIEYKQHKEKFFYLRLLSLAPGIKSTLILKSLDRFGLRSVLEPLIFILAGHSRLGLLVHVLQSIHALYKEMHGMVDVTIQSAHPLDVQQQSIVTSFLEHLTGKKIHAVLAGNPELIAGIRVQSDTFLWEHSVAQQLRSLVHAAQSITGDDV